MNKKGLLNQISIVMIMFIVLIVVMLCFFIAGMIGPIVIGQGKAVTEQIQFSFAASAPNSSLDNATIIAAQTSNNILGLAESIIYLVFFGLIIGYIAVCYYVRTYKWLAFVWVALMFSVILLAALLSNVYQQTAASSADINSFYNDWGTNDFLMNNLPWLMGVFGVFSGILLFVIISIDQEEETKPV